MSQMSFDDVEPEVPGDALYIIGEGEGCPIVKIGRAVDPARRLSKIQTGNPRPLSLLHVAPGAGMLETQVHAHLAGQRLHGEWFDLGDRDPAGEVERILRLIRSGALSPTSALKRVPPRQWVPPRPDQMREAVEAHITASIRAARKNAGLSQSQATELMRAKGFRLHQQTFVRLENGQQVPSAAECKALAEVYGTTIGALVGEVDTKGRESAA